MRYYDCSFMDLAFYIYSFLKERNSRVEIPDFGIFRIEKEHASLDTEGARILPPSEHIFFEDNTSVSNPDLAHFVVEKTGKNLFEVQEQIKEIVRGWVKLLLTQKRLNLQYLGELSLKEVDIILEETRNTNSADFFGLEEVSITKAKNITTNNTIPEKTKVISKKSSNNSMWIALAILGAILVGIMFYFFNKSNKKIENNNQTEKIEEVETNPTTSSEKDSIVIDNIYTEY